MTIQDQQTWNHIFITFLAQVLHFKKIWKHSKSIYLALFYSPRKIQKNSAFHIFIKYYTLWLIQQNLVHPVWTLLALDMNFWNMHSNLWKQIRKPNKTQTDGWGPLVSWTHTSVTPEQRRCSGQPYLTGGEITGDDYDINVFPSSSHVGWWWIRD